jgi:tripartite-type tricarboxylate transporter receptor subunit TctC
MWLRAMLSRRRLLAVSAAASATSFVPSSVTAAGSGSARILVGFPASGTTDVVARHLAAAMTDYASTIVVENRPGGAGRFAIEALKAAARDGSVFLVAPLATMTLYPHVYRTLRYDPLHDFIPVSTVGVASYVLALSSKVPGNVTTLPEFIAWCRGHPDEATFGSPGAGSPLHFIGMQLARAARFAYTHVPYQGAVPALQDILSGQIASCILPIDTPLPYVQSGALRALATSGPRRANCLPAVPTFRELGYPELESVDWWGVFAPAGTSAQCAAKLEATIRSAVEDRKVRDGLTTLSIEIEAIPRVRFAPLLRSEFERWGKVVEASGFTPED